MVTFVLVVGVFNLAIGFLLGVALTEPPPWNQWTPAWLARLSSVRPVWPRSSPSEEEQPAESLAAGPEQAMAPLSGARPLGFKLEELPRRWLESLAAEQLVPGSALEATAQVMRLEIGQYREQLITAENRTRAALAGADADGLRQLCDDLRQFNQDWLQTQSEAVAVLKEQHASHGDQVPAALGLQQVLHDLGALIGECDTTVEALHFRTEIETGCKRVFERLGQLIDQVHALRDRLNDLLAMTLRTSGSLATVTTELQLDHATGLTNRIGVELVFEDWWRNDPARQRQCSVALVDIDRFTRVNQRLGPRVGDRTIVALARLLNDLFRRDRGTDRLVRLSGQAFLVFLGDTGPHQGLTAIERARQTIEATTWDDLGSEFDLTISSGITEINRDDTLMTVLARLTEALKFAKLAGRNRAALDEGSGPKLLDPPQFTVKGRVVRVSEEV